MDLALDGLKVDGAETLALDRLEGVSGATLGRLATLHNQHHRRRLRVLGREANKQSASSVTTGGVLVGRTSTASYVHEKLRAPIHKKKKL